MSCDTFDFLSISLNKIPDDSIECLTPRLRISFTTVWCLGEKTCESLFPKVSRNFCRKLISKFSNIKSTIIILSLKTDFNDCRQRNGFNKNLRSNQNNRKKTEETIWRTIRFFQKHSRLVTFQSARRKPNAFVVLFFSDES